MEDPGSIYATASNTIVVLPEGKQPKEEYHPTPDELYTLGLRNFDDKRYEEAKRYLTPLFNTVTLRPEPYLETARRLFQIHLQGGDARELVRYFEIIKERDQEFEIQFEHIAKLAQAYRAIGEPERAVYVYRSLLDGLFTQEGAVTGTLQEVGQYREALDYIKQLILEYPDIPSVQTAVFTTGGNHGTFYTRLCAALGISTEATLRLLHKTQSAKSLNNLDDLFRSYMLDDPKTFAIAKDAVEQFGELDDAHKHVVQLREQRDHLRALASAADRFATADAVESRTAELAAAVPAYQKRRETVLTKTELTRCTEETAILDSAAQRTAAAGRQPGGALA
ncbi:MAG TPA: hypothetical protein PLH36_18590, partial [Armatimonadota bacterium]|nr:hypothetical protein [Armatimonadota bacterium]